METLATTKSHKIPTVDQGSSSSGIFSGMEFALDFEEAFNKARMPPFTCCTYEQMLFAALEGCVRIFASQSCYDTEYLL